MTVREDFPRILRELLAETGISKKRVAQEAGVSSAAVTHWLNGDNLPSVDRLDPIARLFNVTPTALIRDEKNESRRIQMQDVDVILSALADSRGYKLVPKDG